MNTRYGHHFVALVWLAVLLLACDVSNLTGLIPGGGSSTGGAVPTASSLGAGQSSQAADYLKCDPQKLGFPLLPDAVNCQHLDIITNFQTNLSPKEAIVYYNELLAKEDWKRKDDAALPGIGTWVKGNKQLNIVTVTEKGATTVQIQELGGAGLLPTPVAKDVAPPPTTARGITPSPTQFRGATPLPTARITVPPGQVTALPGPTDPEGDATWTGMSTKGQILNFCVYRNQIYRIHYVTQFTCQDKQTGQRYSNWINISPSDLPPFLIYPDGRFNVNGEYTIPDGVYKDVTFGMVGYIRGSQGRLWTNAESENSVVRCTEGDMPVGIDVTRTNAPCSP